MEVQRPNPEFCTSLVFAPTKVFTLSLVIVSYTLAYISRWSFGGNRIQIKAEARLMGDVLSALGTVDLVGSSATKALQPLRLKQELLMLLLNDERMRLHVWLTPLDNESKRHFVLGHSNSAVNDVGFRKTNGHTAT